MGERVTASWTTAPHFYLVREVNVTRLRSWLETARKQTGARITYTDLLVKLVASTLAQHPRANVSGAGGAPAGRGAGAPLRDQRRPRGRPRGGPRGASDPSCRHAGAERHRGAARGSGIPGPGRQ